MADYVPGIVTVLHGSDMEAMGARTVWESLNLVPGVEARINAAGRPIVSVFFSVCMIKKVDIE